MFTVITAAALLAEGAFGKDKDCGDGYWVIDTRKRGGSDLGACVNPIDVLTTNQGTCNDGETCSWWTIPANELYYGVQCNDDCVCDQDPEVPDNTFLKLESGCSVMKNKREVGIQCFGGIWHKIQSWDDGRSDKGSTWLCAKSTFSKRSEVSCQCYTAEGDVQRSLQQSEAICAQRGDCRAVSCLHGRTDVCTLRTNCHTILYKNEDCYMKNPPQSIHLPNGVIVPLEASPATNAVDSAHVEEGLVAPVPHLLGSSPPQEPQHGR